MYNAENETEFEKALRMAESKSSIIGEKFDNGFIINPNMAIPIIKTYAPEKLEVEVEAFTIETLKDETMLIALREDGTVAYTVSLPKDIMEQAVSLDFEKTLQAMKNDNETWRKKRRLWDSIFAVLLLLCGAFIYFLYKVFLSI